MTDSESDGIRHFFRNPKSHGYLKSNRVWFEIANCSLLYGGPLTSLGTLQRCQNMLAGVVTQSNSRTSAKPLLQLLHWLPIRKRIRHKVATLAFKAHRMSSPPYLSSLLNDHIPSRTLPLPARRAWSCRERALNLPCERSALLHLLCGTVCRSMLLTLTLYLLSKNTQKLICIIAPTSLNPSAKRLWICGIYGALQILFWFDFDLRGPVKLGKTVRRLS